MIHSPRLWLQTNVTFVELCSRWISAYLQSSFRSRYLPPPPAPPLQTRYGWLSSIEAISRIPQACRHSAESASSRWFRHATSIFPSRPGSLRYVRNQTFCTLFVSLKKARQHIIKFDLNSHQDIKKKQGFMLASELLLHKYNTHSI